MAGNYLQLSQGFPGREFILHVPENGHRSTIMKGFLSQYKNESMVRYYQRKN